MWLWVVSGYHQCISTIGLDTIVGQRLCYCVAVRLVTRGLREREQEARHSGCRLQGERTGRIKSKLGRKYYDS